MNPIRTFIQRPIFTAMLVLSLVVFGLFSFPKIGVDQFPPVEFPIITITTILPGADPESIEKNVSQPLEEALNTLSGLESIRSINVESVSQIIIKFSLDKAVDVAAQDVRDRVQSTIPKLPQEIQTPVVEKLDFGAMPIATLGLSGPLPIQELTRIAEDVVKPSLQRLQGVGAVDVVGGRKREISVVIDPARLRAYGLAASDVAGTVRSQSVDIPGGRTSEATVERVVRMQSEARSVEELRGLVIASVNGAPIRIRDVADVIDGPAEARSAATLNGSPAVALSVRKQSGANTVAVAERVKESLAEIGAQLPEGCQLEVIIDGAKFIRSSIHAVEEDLVLGGILAIVIVMIFLRNWRSTLVSAVALPTSVVGTFAVMYALGFTFNIITMLALTLSIGLLIDDAIVVIENVVRHIEEGEPPRVAAFKGTSQIAVAVMAVTLSVMAVFIPVAFMEGMMGKFFYQFGVTVAVAVAISYFVSMTMTPMLSARLLTHHGEGGKVSQAVEGVFKAVESFYRRTLAYALSHRALTVGMAVAVLVVTVGLGRFLKFTFIPSQDMGLFKVDLELPVGTPLAKTELEVSQIASQLQAMPGVVSVYATAGGGVQEEVQKGQIIVNLIPIAGRSFNQADAKQYARESLVLGPGVKSSVGDVGGPGGGGMRTQQIQFNLRGDDWEALLAATETMRAAMLTNPGLVDVDSSYRAGKPQLNIQVDRQRAADLGIPAAVIGSTVRNFLGGDKFASYREGGDSYDVKLRLPAEVRSNPEALGALPLRTMSGQLVELRNVARIDVGEGPSQIDREGLKRQITMLADLKAYSLGEAITFLDDAAAKQLPKTIQTSFEGMGRELGNAGRAFLTALLLGIVLVYMILAAQFESLIDPFTIMLSLPLAVIGAIAGLLIANEYMSMFAMIGMIMLMGLVTKNGILLVDFTNQLRAEGKSTVDALLTAGPIRLRPILMTTIAMIAGMIPVALARGDGAETRVPMAVAIIGGLITSTALTLVVVPVAYSILDGLRRHVTPLTPAEHEAAKQDLAA